MAYINKIQIKDNNGASLGNYSLYGLDEMVKVPYKLVTQHVNGAQTIGNPTETSLRNAIFGDDATLTNQILNGLVPSYNNGDQALDGNLVTYIKNVHNNEFTSKAITAGEEITTPFAHISRQLEVPGDFSYGKIVNSPLNIEWDTYNNKGAITVWSKKQKVSTHKITWCHTPQETLSFVLPQGFGITSSDLTTIDAAITFAVGEEAEASTKKKWSLIPASRAVCPVELGTDGDRFNVLYTQTVKTNELDFQTTATNSPIRITSVMHTDNMALSGKRKKIVTKFNLIDTDTVQSTINWGYRQPGDAPEKALSMMVPNFFSIAADSNGGGEEQGIIFQSIGNKRTGWDTAIYPERAGLAKLGTENKRWGEGWFSYLESSSATFYETDTTYLSCTNLSIENKITLPSGSSATNLTINNKVAGNYAQFLDIHSNSIAVGNSMDSTALANGGVAMRYLIVDSENRRIPNQPDDYLNGCVHARQTRLWASGTEWIQLEYWGGGTGNTHPQLIITSSRNDTQYYVPLYVYKAN